MLLASNGWNNKFKETDYSDASFPYQSFTSFFCNSALVFDFNSRTPRPDSRFWILAHGCLHHYPLFHSILDGGKGDAALVVSTECFVVCAKAENAVEDTAPSARHAFWLDPPCNSIHSLAICGTFSSSCRLTPGKSCLTLRSLLLTNVPV